MDPLAYIQRLQCITEKDIYQQDGPFKEQAWKLFFSMLQSVHFFLPNLSSKFS